jgi:hypothetical protein
MKQQQPAILAIVKFSIVIAGACIVKSRQHVFDSEIPLCKIVSQDLLWYWQQKSQAASTPSFLA